MVGNYEDEITYLHEIIDKVFFMSRTASIEDIDNYLTQFKLKGQKMARVAKDILSKIRKKNEKKEIFWRVFALSSFLSAQSQTLNASKSNKNGPKINKRTLVNI